MPEEPQIVQANKDKSTLFWKLSCAVLVLALSGVGALSYFLYQAYNDVDCPVVEDLSTYSIADLGTLTFEYPIGWHILELWPEEADQAIIYWIDDEFLSTAPRGGPGADVTVNIWYNQEDPNKLFDQRRTEINSSYTEPNQEIIKTSLGDVYRLYGTQIIYEAEVQTEHYILMNDATIIEVIPSFTSVEYGSVARHVATSFKVQ
ncbi:hypothetical protein OAL67_01290 [bacterium]|nr:hypothetical protein [bacterium]